MFKDMILIRYLRVQALDLVGSTLAAHVCCLSVVLRFVLQRIIATTTSWQPVPVRVTILKLTVSSWLRGKVALMMWCAC